MAYVIIEGNNAIYVKIVQVGPLYRIASIKIERSKSSSCMKTYLFVNDIMSVFSAAKFTLFLQENKIALLRRFFDKFCRKYTSLMSLVNQYIIIGTL